MVTPVTRDPAHAEGAPWVLVVDDDVLLREATAAGLAESGFRVRQSNSAHDAVEELSRNLYDAVVLDVELQGATAFDVTRILKDGDQLKDTAVLFVSGHCIDETTAIRAIETGACDFLRRPFGLGELRARLFAAIRSRRTIADLRRIGNVDELTGLLNRRGFYEELERERRRASREGSVLSLVVLDVDRFKTVNDLYGHAVGDIALRAVGDVLACSCRSTDVAGRIGGEEFVVALPSTDAVAAAAVAEKLRVGIASFGIPLPGGTLSVTASFGFASAHGDHLGPRESATELLAAADAALYRAKRAGRDRVEAA